MIVTSQSLSSTLLSYGLFRDLFLVECLIELLVTMVDRQPKVCEASHVSTLLSAYLASTSIIGNHIVAGNNIVIGVALY